MNLKIRKLTTLHNISEFDCGEEELNKFLRRDAIRQQKNCKNNCFVLLEGDSFEVIGFYTLCARSLPRRIFKPFFSNRQLESYKEVPVFLLGRFAIDRKYQNKKLGKFLLFDAIKRCKESDIGGMGVVVDAKHEKAMKFYLHHDFFEIEPLMAFFSFINWHLPDTN